MFKINAMDHIVLNVPDINRSLAFYMDVLRLEPERLDQFRRGEVRFPSVRISQDTVIDLSYEARGSARRWCRPPKLEPFHHGCGGGRLRGVSEASH
jgi:catechol 2,3-dioxygenase-like lactoylglutathione lyase family enzyme